MDVSGLWQVVLELPGGNQEVSMEMIEDGDDLRGQLLTESGPQTLNGSMHQESVSWTVNQNTANGPLSLVFDGIVSGEQISGNIEVGDIGLGGTFLARRVE